MAIDTYAVWDPPWSSEESRSRNAAEETAEWAAPDENLVLAGRSLLLLQVESRQQ
ncbi:hypothetical protein PGT21_005330 [Puccinia graminis f. sp. tritici]|uniref:Uncharacterized protein n=1 Tax=Puccinia graminis f. sp. tritici TaxID=56615 RepID=A0A5B0QMR1_PUCGR|nr:hypothetical protein PGT21_005330 [Puccinia graminis f. sp. tritici]